MKLEKIVLIVATLTSFFTVFLSSAVMVAVPTLASEFGMSNIIQNWVTMLFFLAVAIFTIPSGQLSGKFGLKKSMIFGSSVYILSSIAAIFSINSEIFFNLSISSRYWCFIFKCRFNGNGRISILSTRTW